MQYKFEFVYYYYYTYWHTKNIDELLTDSKNKTELWKFK